MNRQVLSLLHVIVVATSFAARAAGQNPIAIDTRRELLVDDYLLDRVEGKAALRLHRPIAREVVLVFDRHWEGNSCGAYSTVFVDAGRYRMYYQAAHQTLVGEAAAHPAFMCYAESSDGIHWAKPKLGLFEFAGSKENNILWRDLGAEGLSPFRDLNATCTPEARYKAIGAGQDGKGRTALVALRSADGVRWSRMHKAPLAVSGGFDSQNLAFWDALRGEYRLFFRDFREGRRDIRTARSKDFLNWSTPEWLTTKPITFQGSRLTLNFSTSAAGTIRVEIQDVAGKRLEELALSDCSEVFGDDLQRTVTWKRGSDLSKLAGQPVRLRFTLSDADLYAFQFQPAGK